MDDRRRVLLRVDGSSKIGLGHLIRCIGLGVMLNEGFEVTVVSKTIPDAITAEIFSKGLKFISISNEIEFFALLKENDIVVIDNYAFDLNYEQQLKKCNVKLVRIDDLGGLTTIADLVINHSPNISKTDYIATPETLFSLGIQYVLLRPKFLELAKGSIEILKKKYSLFINFGGSDANGFTLKILEYLQRIPIFEEINVVIGSAFNKDEALAIICKNDSRIMLHKAIDEEKMLQLMMKSEIAIVPASGVLFELVCVKTTSIVGFYVPNQEKFHNFLVKHENMKTFGNFFDLDFETFNQVLNEQLNEMSANNALIKMRMLMAFSKQNHIRQFKLL